MLAVLFAYVPDFREKSTLIYTNLLIGVFNLIPICPLDGGRILYAILENLFSKKLTENICHIVYNISTIFITVIAAIGIIYLKNISILLIAIFLCMLTVVENKRYKIKQRVYKIINKGEN